MNNLRWQKSLVAIKTPLMANTLKITSFLFPLISVLPTLDNC